MALPWYDETMNTADAHDLLITIINDLLVKHKDSLRQAFYLEVSEDFWQELRLNLRYSSPVVSGNINYAYACKWAKEQVSQKLDNAAQLILNKSLGCWGVRFVQNKRFLSPDDLVDDNNKIQPLNKKILYFATYSDAELACKQVYDSYQAALIECPAIELVALEQNKKIIDWLCHHYQPNP